MKSSGRNRRDRKSPNSATPSVEGEKLQKALALHQHGQLDSAEALYREILAMRPRQTDALQFLGVLIAQRGQPQEALGLIDQAIACNSTNATAWSNRGNALVALKRHEDALESYDRALAIDPRHIDALYNMGTTLSLLGHKEEALASYDRLLAIQPNHVQALNHRGIELCKLGKRLEAITSFRRALVLQPDSAQLHANLGTALFEVRQLDLAKIHLRKALTGKKTAAVFQNLAEVLYQLGKFEAATEIYRQWTEFEPDNPIPQHMAAAGNNTQPERAGDQYVTKLFDGFAESFETTLLGLGYRVPELLTAQIRFELGSTAAPLRILDAGCGTGLAAPLLKPLASQLVGVDLSSAMLEKARARELYDELVAGELCAFMSSRPDSFDLIVLADTLVYFGALEEAFQSTHSALTPGGIFAFAVESRTAGKDEPTFKLEPHGRYTHRCDYVTETLATSGFTLCSRESIAIRKELNADVPGIAIVARRTGTP